MRIVITGGSGLIGTALADHFLEKGQEVIILSRNPEYKKRSPAGAKLVEWDGREPGAWAQWVDGAEAVINLAGAGIAGDSPLRMRWTAKRKNTILESRVKAGEAVSAAIRSAKVKPKVLIQSSAVGIYGPRGDEIIDEGFPHGDDFLAEVCKQWETSTAPVEEMGIRRVVMRTGLVFAGRGGIFPLLKLPFSLFAGGPLGHGRQYLSWVHIEDIVQAVQHFIGNEHTQGVYNMTAPAPASNREFARLMGEAMNRPAFIPAPDFALKIALGEASMLALEGQRVVPKRLQEHGFKFKYDSLEKALPALLGT